MVTNIHATNGILNMHPTWLILFPQGGGGVEIFFPYFCNNAPLPRGVWIFSFNKNALLTLATHVRMN
jgi:hypothetical protein